MTGVQLREARQLLGLSGARLDMLCGLPNGTIQVFEKTGRMAQSAPKHLRGDRVAAVRGVLEGAGVVFTDGEEPGVKLRKVEE